MSSARRVADIPELIGSIATFLPNSYLLLLTSKQFLHSVAPLIWKSVPRLDLLLRLIPGVSVSRIIRRDKVNSAVRSVLVDVKLPSTLDLTRFNVYAPWVQHLEVFGGTYRYTLHNAGALFHLASTRSILPNLRALTISIEADTTILEYVSFTELFLSPTLAEIRHVRQGGVPPYLKRRLVPSLVQKILSVCPGIQLLELYPGEAPSRDNPSGRDIIFSLPEVSLHADLAQFSNLRSFTSTLYVFEPATLQALGSLPLLESLDVFDCAEDAATLDGGLATPETWFPALRHLHLRNFDSRDVTVIWNQPFVRNLESATIKCDTIIAEGGFATEAGQEWVDGFITKLPQASPHISKLALDFEPAPAFRKRTYWLSHAGINALRQLPLRSIWLYSIWALCEDLAPALPGVEEFHCKDGWIGYKRLCVFATYMPRLRSLTADVRWTTSSKTSKVPLREVNLSTNLFPPPPVVLKSSFKLSKRGLSMTQLREMAKFVAGIWPGGFCGEIYSGARELGDDKNLKKLNQLNELVSEYLAEADAARARSAI